MICSLAHSTGRLARKRPFGSPEGRTTVLGTKAAQGAGFGAAIGGMAGAIVAVVATVGTSIALSGLGFVIAGPIEAALAAAGTVGVAPTLMGTLVGWDIPEARVKEYGSGIRGGSILMGINPRNAEDADYLEGSWRSTAGTEVTR